MPSAPGPSPARSGSARPAALITGATGAERIYDGYPDVALDMVSTRTFDGRIQLLEGVPRLLAGPPGVNPRPLE